MQAALNFNRDDETFSDDQSDETMNVACWIGCPVGDRHKIVKHIGTGGMGRVFLAEHVTLGAQAAVKVLASRCTPMLVERFVAEARLLALLNHPNIVKVFDIGEMVDETPYILMEHVAGIDLGEWLRRHEQLSLKRVLRILRQVASALDYLHAQGIVHRDIKPPNIMVDPDAGDAVKLLDFGIAVREGTSDVTFGSGLLGTPAYMAPEQVAGSGCGKSADLYALGALALELLTGKPPYDYPSLNLVLAAVLHERPGLPSTRGIQIDGFDDVMERALAREPSARYQSALEFIDALTEVLSSRRSSMPAPRATSARDLVRSRGSLIRHALAMAGAAMAWFA
jgi:serine/threonine-protein kinase